MLDKSTESGWDILIEVESFLRRKIDYSEKFIFAICIMRL
jgi:hypothetical protein